MTSMTKTVALFLTSVVGLGLGSSAAFAQAHAGDASPGRP